MKPHRAGTAAGIAALLVLVAVLAGCSLGMLGEGDTGTARLEISMKQPAARVTSAALVVTGPGMAPITREISPGDSETRIQIPAGRQRTLRVLINTVSVTFADESTVDLVAGQERIVTLHPELTATQIIIPDATNGRVVQVADMKGTGWIEKYGADFGYDSGPFEPYDVDFDAQGRIYVANVAPGEVSVWVLRLDDINDTTYEPIVDSTDLPSGVQAIAVDRANGYLYYVDQSSSDVYRKKLGPPLGDQEQFYVQGTDGLSTHGLAVDPEGYLYLVIDSGGYPQHTVIKADTVSPIEGSAAALAVFGPALPPGILNDPQDVVVKPPYVYVANLNTADWYTAQSIVQLTLDLEFVDEFGEPWYGEGPLPPGVFLGPKRFVATLNPGLTLIDEYYEVDRIVSFRDMNGTDWTTYGSSGSGKDEFNFFDLLLPQ
jgi:DNA-binding beta-propeller fold protein YncE